MNSIYDNLEDAYPRQAVYTENEMVDFQKHLSKTLQDIQIRDSDLPVGKEHTFKPMGELQKFRRPRSLKELPNGSTSKDPLFLINDDRNSGISLRQLIESHIYITEVNIQFIPLVNSNKQVTVEHFYFMMEESGLDLSRKDVNEDKSLAIEGSFKEAKMIEPEDNTEFIDMGKLFFKLIFY